MNFYIMLNIIVGFGLFILVKQNPNILSDTKEIKSPIGQWVVAFFGVIFFPASIIVAFLIKKNIE